MVLYGVTCKVHVLYVQRLWFSLIAQWWVKAARFSMCLILNQVLVTVFSKSFHHCQLFSILLVRFAAPYGTSRFKDLGFMLWLILNFIRTLSNLFLSSGQSQACSASIRALAAVHCCAYKVMEPACHGLCREGGFWELLLTEALDHFRRGGTYCMLTLVGVIKTVSWLYYILFKTLLFFLLQFQKTRSPSGDGWHGVTTAHCWPMLRAQGL